MIAENTARAHGGNYPTVKLDEMLNPAPVDTRSGEEIAADIIKKAGLKVVK